MCIFTKTNNPSQPTLHVSDLPEGLTVQLLLLPCYQQLLLGRSLRCPMRHQQLLTLPLQSHCFSWNVSRAHACTLTASLASEGCLFPLFFFFTKRLWRDVLAFSWLLAVLIYQSNEHAPMHGHQAITTGFHANREHHGMSLYWELSSVTMVGRRQNTARTWLADVSICCMSFLDGTNMSDDGLFINLKNTLLCHCGVTVSESECQDCL